MSSYTMLDMVGVKLRTTLGTIMTWSFDLVFAFDVTQKCYYWGEL